MKLPILLRLFSLLFLAACTAPPVSELPLPTAASGTPSSPISTPSPAAPDQPAATETPADPVEATAAPPSAEPSAPSPTPSEDTRTRYQVSAELDYAGHRLVVAEQIDYTNTSGGALSDLVLIVEPTRYPSVFQLETLAWEDGLPVAGVERSTGQLRLPLRQPLPPGARLRLSLAYTLDLPSPDPAYYGRPVPFGYSARQTNLVDWYPYVPPYIPGQGWLVHTAGYFGEYLVYPLVDFDVRLRLTGERTADLLIAASAPAESDGDWQRYRLPAARSFAWSVSDQYRLTTQAVGTVTVLSYAFPYHAQAGEAARQVSSEALQLYTRLYGPYPHQTLSVVEADFLDGMEYSGLYFLSKGFYNLHSGSAADYLTAIAAHETAHQWWFEQVGNDQALEPWLDEALCTYSERLYFENLHPEALPWWWEYRVRYYQPHGRVNGSIYNPEGYRAYRDAVYLNGALFLEELRARLGDETFFTFLQAYLRQYAGQTASTADFFTLLGAHTSADLDDILAKYFQR